MTTRPTHVIDPVCGMTVEVAAAEAAGLLVELDGRTYAFCRAGCKRAFLEDPAAHATDEALAAAPVVASGVGAVGGELPVIDEGMRRWYESCSCCLSEAYPEIKAQLDAEHAAAHAEEGVAEQAH